MTTVLYVPATFGLVTLAEPIVRLLFEHGRLAQTFVKAVVAATMMALISLAAAAKLLRIREFDDAAAGAAGRFM